MNANVATDECTRVNKYYFASYAKAILELSTTDNGDNGDNDIDHEYASPLDDLFCDLRFYEKRFYCAHLRSVTFEHKNDDDAEELLHFSKDCESDENDYVSNKIKLRPNEWIEDLSSSSIVCFGLDCDDDRKEIDGLQYLKNQGYNYEWVESGIIKFATWCNKSDVR